MARTQEQLDLSKRDLIMSDLSDVVMYFDPDSGRALTITALLQRAKMENKTMEAMKSKYEPIVRGAGDARWPTFATIPETSPTKDEVKAAFQKAGVGVLRGKQVILQPPLVKVTSDERRTQLSVGDEVAPGYDIADAFPNFDKTATKVLPSYYPRYRRVPPDRAIFAVIDQMLKSTEVSTVIKASLSNLLNEMLDLVSTHYFGNGGIAGQLSRHRACLDVKAQINTWLNTADGIKKMYVYPQEAYEQLMNKRFPLRKVPVDLTGLTVVDVISDVQVELQQGTEETPGYNFTSITTSSEAGPLWLRGPHIMLKRGNVVTQDITLADTLLENLGVVDQKGGMGIEAFMQRWKWATLAVAKPKAEVYLNTARTRNIFVLNSFSQLPAQIILKPTHQRAPNAFSNDDAWSIIGWSPFLGGMTAFVMHFLNHGEDAKPLVYADNVYLVRRDSTGKLWFISADGSKMEASIFAEMVALENVRSLKHFNGYDAAWQNYATVFHPNTVVGATAILGKFQFEMPYMGSGAMGTGYNNTVKSITWVDRLLNFEIESSRHVLDTTKPEQGGVWLKANKGAGCVMLVENRFELDDWKDHSFTIHRADILGSSFIWLDAIGLPGVAAPQLDHERLVKALTFIKRPVSKSSPLVSAALQLMRLRMLYLLGWADSPIDELIRVSAHGILNEYRANPAGHPGAPDPAEEAATLAEYLESPLLGDMADDDNFRAFVTARSVPILSQVLEIVAGKAAVGQFAAFLLNNPLLSPVAANYCDLEILASVAEELEIDWSPPDKAVVMVSGVPMVVPIAEAMVIPEETKKVKEWGLESEPSAPQYTLPKIVRRKGDVAVSDVLVGAFGSREKWVKRSDKELQISLVDRSMVKANVPLKFSIVPAPSKTEMGVSLRDQAAGQIASILRVPHQAAWMALAKREVVAMSSDPSVPPLSLAKVASAAPAVRAQIAKEEKEAAEAEAERQKLLAAEREEKERVKKEKREARKSAPPAPAGTPPVSQAALAARPQQVEPSKTKKVTPSRKAPVLVKPSKAQVKETEEEAKLVQQIAEREARLKKEGKAPINRKVVGEVSTGGLKKLSMSFKPP